MGIANSVLHANVSGRYETAGLPGIFVKAKASNRPARSAAARCDASELAQATSAAGAANWAW